MQRAELDAWHVAGTQLMITKWIYCYREGREVSNVKLGDLDLTLRQWGSIEGFIAELQHDQDFKAYSAQGHHRVEDTHPLSNCCACTSVAQQLVCDYLVCLGNK